MNCPYLFTVRCLSASGALCAFGAFGAFGALCALCAFGALCALCAFGAYHLQQKAADHMLLQLIVCVE